MYIIFVYFGIFLYFWVMGNNPFVDEDNVRQFFSGWINGRGSAAYRHEGERFSIYKDFYDVLPVLSFPALKLLMYIGRELKSGQDIVALDRRSYIVWSRDSSFTNFHKGVQELISHSVLYPAGRSRYYINPSVLFKGSKIRFLDNLRKSS